MTLDDVATEILEGIRTCQPGEESGVILGAISKREAWVVDTFQKIRRTEEEARDAMASSYRAKSRRGKAGAANRSDACRALVRRLETELGVEGKAPAGPIVHGDRSAGRSGGREAPGVVPGASKPGGATR